MEFKKNYFTSGLEKYNTIINARNDLRAAKETDRAEREAIQEKIKKLTSDMIEAAAERDQKKYNKLQEEKESELKKIDMLDLRLETLEAKTIATPRDTREFCNLVNDECEELAEKTLKAVFEKLDEVRTILKEFYGINKTRLDILNNWNYGIDAINPDNPNYPSTVINEAAKSKKVCSLFANLDGGAFYPDGKGFKEFPDHSRW